MTSHARLGTAVQTPTIHNYFSGHFPKQYKKKPGRGGVTWDYEHRGVCQNLGGKWVIFQPLGREAEHSYIGVL